MTRILAIADEVQDSMYGAALKELEPDLVVACGDLPFDYLEYIVTVSGVPLLYVPGNHDPDLRRPAGGPRLPSYVRDVEPPPRGPEGCVNIDGRIVDEGGLRLAGLGGSVRYSTGPNQYTQTQMRLRALRLEIRARVARRAVDVLVTHTPPADCGDQDDPPHRGFEAFHRLVKKLGPKYLVHGHIHPYGQQRPDLKLRETIVVNAVGHRILEVVP